jgi:hypothetical protein
MATLAELRAIVEDAYENRVRPYVVSRQNAYFAAHGRYWQGLRTHGIPPQDPDEAAPDVGAAKPSDIAEGWPAEVLGQNFPMAIQIDAYQSPDGPGYVGTVWARWQGQVWRRSLVFGPADYLARPWHRVMGDQL